MTLHSRARQTMWFVVRLMLPLFVLIALMPQTSSAVGPVGNECMVGYGSDVAAISTVSQVPVHYRVLVNRFHAPTDRKPDGMVSDYSGGCRDDVQGQLKLIGKGQTDVVNAIIRRDKDGLFRTFTLYGLNRPLTSIEKQRAESELESLRSITSFPILHLPVWIEGLAVTYNLGCSTGNPNNELILTSTALSGIFTGTITRWSDDQIRIPHNLGLTSETCKAAIHPAVRADANEQTLVFKDYLSKRQPQWKGYMQDATNTKWPSTLYDACRGRGDAGIATCVEGTPGGIGFVSFATAERFGLNMASIESSNPTELVAKPSVQGCTTAAQSIPYPEPSTDWSHVSLTDAPAGYPICSIQYLLAFQFFGFSYRDGAGVAQVRTVKDYIKWSVLTATQSRLADYQLAKLPSVLQQKTIQGAREITYKDPGA